MLFSEPKIPQCRAQRGSKPRLTRFSALQRAENSSIPPRAGAVPVESRVSVLFSEPKIPQSARSFPTNSSSTVSVLFSEPKIPQFAMLSTLFTARTTFQCSSASRKFLNKPGVRRDRRAAEFQCSSASRKFLNQRGRCVGGSLATVSVLFSEPKIPQCSDGVLTVTIAT